MRLESHVLSLLEKQQPLVLVTVFDKQGSGPRQPGAKIIVTEDGQVYGTIGGGRVENQAVLYARDFFAVSDQAILVNYNLIPGREGDNIDMLCGGRVSLLFEKLQPDTETRELFKRYEATLRASERGVWLVDMTELESSRQIVRRLAVRGEDREQFPPVLLDNVFAGRNRPTAARLLDVAGKTWFVDPFTCSGTLLLVGAGHIAYEVARLAQQIDFEIKVVDDRAEFANPERFPQAAAVEVVGGFEQVFSSLPVDNDCYILILTRGHVHDQTVLEQALATDARYIGMIGSRKKRDAIYENLRRKGVADARLQEVHCPIGLAIGAESPVEIAISIIAELIRARAC